MRIQCGLISKEELLRGTNADMWSLAWGPLRSGLGWEVECVPSHFSCNEAAAAGVSHEDWLGNDKANQAAKVQAHAADARHCCRCGLTTKLRRRRCAG